MTDTHLSNQTFKELNLHPDLIKGLDEIGFTYCTPIQALALPIALQGKDVSGQAQTGTGKTAAFLLATMQRLMNEVDSGNEKESDQTTTANAAAETDSEGTEQDTSVVSEAETDTATGNDQADTGATTAANREDEPEPKPKPTAKKDAKRGKTRVKALILAPTRELAIQIHKDAEFLVKYTPLKLGLAYGGTGYESQKQTLEDGVDILIGTPGRIIDYFKQGVFTLAYTEVVVMDEADRMFDLGFIKDIRFLLNKMPPPDQRLNMLFSATLSFRVNELAYEQMNAPAQVTVEAERVVERIKETAYYPAQDEKIPLLINLLNQTEGRGRSLVFVNTKHEAAKIEHWLTANKFNTAILSGDVPQSKRERLLQDFHDGKKDILVATDVAARGLHIEGVTHVFNYDIPQDAEDYVHRAGRTARAGESGHAISLVCEKYAYSIMDIEQYIDHSIAIEPLTEALLAAPEITPKAMPPRERRGSKKPFNDSRSSNHSSKSQSSRSTSPTSAPISNGDSKPRFHEVTGHTIIYTDDSMPTVNYTAPATQQSTKFGEIPAVG